MLLFTRQKSLAVDAMPRKQLQKELSLILPLHAKGHCGNNNQALGHVYQTQGLKLLQLKLEAHDDG